ncbi:hypothetical protein BD310DRAFT_341501 [Dichomitus squalens]|uniref:Secreted protein n=1 Tax=Dichomitus squalens TaxID=114155 RepID=A0A4Q9Q045_9APHY|nr:hypothetical protein BD310DRAFT_341501 [Dichomitus squalens]
MCLLTSALFLRCMLLHLHGSRGRFSPPSLSVPVGLRSACPSICLGRHTYTPALTVAVRNTPHQSSQPPSCVRSRLVTICLLQ